MSDELSPAEARFFETGELPPELATPPADDPPADAAIDPAAAAAATTAELPADEPADPTADLIASLRHQLNEAEARRAATDERLSALISRLDTLSTTPEPAAPDPQTDPFGHLQHQLSTLTKSFNALQENYARANTQTDQQAQLASFVEHVRGLRDEFAQATPDFNDAYKHLREARTQDLLDAGVPRNQIPQRLLEEEVSVARNALTAGKNPAQVLYNIAKRNGYAAKAAPSTPAARVAQLKAGVAAAKTVPQTGANIELTPDALREASDADLDKVIQSDEMWNKMVGGTTTGKGIF